MSRQLRPAVVLLVLLTALTGVAYPLLVTLVAQIAFPAQARGSLVVRGDGVVGSALIGQPFSDARYFWGRPSATSPFEYNAADPDNRDPIPADLVTSSGSGLDPHISPAAARWQVHRVAAARGLDPAAVQALVDRDTEGRQLGFLGEARVNVLALNLALDAPPVR